MSHHLGPLDLEAILPVRPFDDPHNPAYGEVTAYLAGLLRHSATVEHYLAAFGVRVDDGQHPHDLAGPGNKLEWGVMRGLALKVRDTPEKQRRYLHAIERHRAGQRHHHMWNDPNPAATDADLRYGAIDAIVSLREPRDYQGGSHSWNEIAAIIGRNPPHKQPWMRWALEQIAALDRAGNGKSTPGPY